MATVKCVTSHRRVVLSSHIVTLSMALSSFFLFQYSLFNIKICDDISSDSWPSTPKCYSWHKNWLTFGEIVSLYWILKNKLKNKLQKNCFYWTWTPLNLIQRCKWYSRVFLTVHALFSAKSKLKHCHKSLAPLPRSTGNDAGTKSYGTLRYQVFNTKYHW